MRFQYKVVSLSPGNNYDLQRQLNRLGEDEWELINLNPITSEIWSNGEKESEHISSYTAIFKRSA